MSQSDVLIPNQIPTNLILHYYYFFSPYYYIIFLPWKFVISSIKNKGKLNKLKQVQFWYINSHNKTGKEQTWRNKQYNINKNLLLSRYWWTSNMLDWTHRDLKLVSKGRKDKWSECWAAVETHLEKIRRSWTAWQIECQTQDS